MMVQILWDNTLSWDDSVNESTAKEVEKHLVEIKSLQKNSMRKSLNAIIAHSNKELHGFCHNDEKRFGAVIWLI